MYSELTSPTSRYPTKLSSHFTLEEAIRSETAERLGIDNLPPLELIPAMKATALNLEMLRAMIGVPIQINSWYRSKELNTLLRSKETSQHRDGEAVDIIAPKYGSCLSLCKFIIANQGNIRFDQLILEHSWVHISFAIRSGTPRGQVLSLLKSGKYAQGLTDPHGTSYR